MFTGDQKRMQLNQEQIELVVQRVLARLSGASSPMAGMDFEPSNTADSDSATHRFRGNVFGVKDIADEANELWIESRAIITPLARDELRRRNIQIVRFCGMKPVRGDHASSRFNLIYDRRGSVQESVVKEVLEKIHDPNHAFAIVLTYRPQALNCLLNRDPGIRAAIVESAECVKAAEIQIHPNVLIVDTSRQPWRQGSLLRSIENELEKRRSL